MSFLTRFVLPDLPRPVAQIVHIGAGTAQELDRYTATGAKTVLLAEADPDTAAELAARTAGLPGVRVVAAAVSGDLRPRPFYRMSFPALNSLRAPAALRDLFPGLHILSDDTVTPASPAALFDDTGPDDPGAKLLVLKTPGEALGILRALDAAGLLSGFDTVCLREGIAPLYDGAAPAGEIRDFLVASGFGVLFEQAPEDPDIPWLRARIDRVRLERKKHAAVSAELAKLKTHAETLVQERDAARAELDTLRAELETLKSPDRREQLLHDELRKAAEQVRLARDLLPGGPEE